MRKAYLIHGWGGSPEEPMLLWIKQKLEEKGYEVVAPEMPNTEEPKINEWIGKISEVGSDINEETIFIGHSIGCQSIMRYLEKLSYNVKVAKVIFIAPWLHLDEKTIEEEGEEAVEIAKPWIKTPIDFEKVKAHSEKFICIFSDNDPYVPLSDRDLFKERLNAKIVTLNNRGHFDPDSGIKDLPEILEFF